MRIVYIAAPLGHGPDREANRAEAAKWVTYCADGGNAPIATWITLSGEWDESRREEGLAIDKRLIEVCDEVWFCGPRISRGMQIEGYHAIALGKPVFWVRGRIYLVSGECRGSAVGQRLYTSDLASESETTMRKLRVSKTGFQACQQCGLLATLRSLDIAVPPIPERRSGPKILRHPEVPGGWAALVALCGMCWTDVVKMLREQATPDASGEVSP